MEILFQLAIFYILLALANDWFFKETSSPLTFRQLRKFNFQSFFIAQAKMFFSFLKLSEDSLSRQPVFWLGTILPLLAASIIEVKILQVNEIELSIQNINVIFEFSKIPLYILALTPTLGVFISNIHRTIQTKKQIETAEKKNISDGYYAHLKYITDCFNNLALAEKSNSKIKVLQENPFIILRPNSLYKAIFIESSISGGFKDKVSDKFIKNVTMKLRRFNKKIVLNELEYTNILNERKIKDIHKIITECNAGINEILNCFYATCKKSSLIEAEYVNENNVKRMNIDLTMLEIGWGKRRIYDFIIYLFDVIDLKVSSHPELKKEIDEFFELIKLSSSVRKSYLAAQAAQAAQGKKE
ncbi:hypothetical protein P9423_05900 [Enterobacter mori]|uniref:hypothetical protein n=1 Tax=Enterobacter mori TaxID=539813 RepID=UPI0038927253